MSNLRNTIAELASTFASSVLSAIRGASLEEILAETAETGGGIRRRGPGRPRAAAAPAESVGRLPRARRVRGGRLARRSAEDIAEIVDRIVAVLSKRPKGLRAEQIRAELGLEAKELQRPIVEALAGRRISKVGHKRATTYFAKGAAPMKAAPAKGKRAAKRAKRKSSPKRAAKAAPAAGTLDGVAS